MSGLRLPALSLTLGLAGGAVVGALSRAMEVSRISFGPYALSGNGALAVSVVLAPLAIFAGWTWLVRRSPAAARDIAIFTAGLALGTNLGYDAVSGHPSSAVAGLFFFGPTAFFAAVALALLRWRRVTSTPALTATLLGGTLLGVVPPFSFFGGLGTAGISAAAAIVASLRSTVGATVAVGAALALLVLTQVFALPLLAAPLIAGR